MDVLNFAEFNEDVINVNKITKISYDNNLNLYAISIENEPSPIMINKTQYIQFIDHLKRVSRSYFIES